MRLWRVALLVLGLCAGSLAQAHPLAPALLELRETGELGHALLWRSSVLRSQGRELLPVLPAACEREGAIETEDRDGARSQRWTLRCTAPLSGQVLAVDGLEGSGVNVIVRIEAADGRVQQALLGERRPSYTVLTADVRPPVFADYLRLGIEHLLLGPDHLLFVFGLVLLIRRPRRLLLAVTAFTLGHSLTLGLAALGLLRLPQALTEFAIALSIFWLACELLRPRDAPPGWLRRWPGPMAIAFGLLHGLGFAGALAEIGLPTGEIPLALFAFNLGIELGQLLLVALTLLALRAVQGWSLPQPAAALPAYLLGSMASYWGYERLGAVFGG